MSDLDSIQYDAIEELIAEEKYWNEANKAFALEQCIYLFVEGESEEVAFRILLEEGLGIDFSQFGIVIANYNGIGNLKHVIRIMGQTLSHDRPMIFTYDDDNPSQVPVPSSLSSNMHLFKIPCLPIVTLTSGLRGGAFEESFDSNDFIDACFDTKFLKDNPQVLKNDFISVFDSDKPFHAQITKFLHGKGLTTNGLPKPEIAENMAIKCDPIPDTYVKLADLIKKIRIEHPVKAKNITNASTRFTTLGVVSLPLVSVIKAVKFN